jgi:methylglutaconyl-CoA hydratase
MWLKSRNFELMNHGTIFVEIVNRIATVEFYHPASNSFPSELLAKLAKVFADLSSNEDVRIILLKSEGVKAFCAGASFNELIAITDREEGKSFFMGFANVINAMRNCRKLIVGRIQGSAVGGGVGLVAACDIALATENASVKLSELSIGIGPFVIAPAVERKIGVSGLSSLSLNPTKWKNAYWAQKSGLYSEVYDSVEELDKAAEQLTEELSKYNPEALVEMKRILWKNTKNWEILLEERAEISGKLVLSDFTKESLLKFKK